jgi:competence protein ComEC
VLVSLDTPQPDMMIAADLQSVAVRGQDGKLAIVRTGSDTFAAREWLAADADARAAKDETLARGILCDDVGCIARLKDGRMVAVARAAEAFEEDCLRAAVVISTRQPPADCPALVIGRRETERAGAIALRITETSFEITPARPPSYDRPWAPMIVAPTTTAESSVQSGDQTPAIEDLTPGD